MSATTPEIPKGRPSRRQVENAQLLAAIEYGAEAIAERLTDYTVRQEQSFRGILLRGALVVQVGTGGTVRASVSAGSLVGWALHNTGVAPAQVNLRDGNDAGGTLIAPITLNPGESTRDSWGPGGIAFTSGLFVELVTGTFEGAVFLKGPDS